MLDHGHPGIPYSHFRETILTLQEIAERATLPSLMPALKLRIFAMTDLDAISTELRALRGAGASASDSTRRNELWRELNTASFTRALAVVWAAPLLSIFVKVGVHSLVFPAARTVT